MSDITPLEHILITEEGYRPDRYRDSVGVWTIGYGHAILSTDDRGQMDKIHALALLRDDIARAKERCKNFEWFPQLNDCRRDCITALVFQLGFRGFSQFRRCITAIIESDYDQAAAELLASDYADQCPNRARRASQWLKSGEYPTIT